MYRPGITEKRFLNKRFMRTEKDILEVFLRQDDNITIDEMAQKVGVARSTIYHHHRAVWMIVPDYKKFIHGKFRRQVRRMLRDKNVRMKSLYMSLILFIAQYRDIFDLFSKRDERDVVTTMLNEMLPKSERAMHLPKNSETILAAYTGEVTELIWRWIKNGCQTDEIEKLLGYIMYLTDTARDRLKPLLD